MNKTEKIFVLGAFVIFALYFVLFNMNLPHYWNNSPRAIPENIIDVLWVLSLTFAIITLILCIRDSGKRNLASRASWVVYMIVVGVIGIPHYYLKHGRHPRG